MKKTYEIVTPRSLKVLSNTTISYKSCVDQYFIFYPLYSSRIQFYIKQTITTSKQIKIKYSEDIEEYPAIHYQLASTWPPHSTNNIMPRKALKSRSYEIVKDNIWKPNKIWTTSQIEILSIPSDVFHVR